MGEHAGHDGYGGVQQALRGPTRELRRAIPDVYKGFAALHDGALTPEYRHEDQRADRLRDRHKRMLRRCIAAHAHAAVRHGATPQEAAEAIGVAILMSGGPATIYGPRGYAAFQEFHAAAHPETVDTTGAKAGMN